MAQEAISNYPNQLFWTNYINYSDKPNIQLMENGEWITLEDIKIDEEILEDPKRLLMVCGEIGHYINKCSRRCDKKSHSKQNCYYTKKSI